MNRTLGVLISGRGSNLQAIVDAIREGRLDARIAVVISNRADAYGLERARAAGIEALCISHRAFPTREAFEAALVAELRTSTPRCCRPSPVSTRSARRSSTA